MIKDSPLRQETDYSRVYGPDVLFPIERAESRVALGLPESLPFHGVDILNAWELTWLSDNGQPRVASAEIRIPASSPNIIESKSLKLYLNSLAMRRFDSVDSVRKLVANDLSATAGAAVDVKLFNPAETEGKRSDRLPGSCIDDGTADCDDWSVKPELLTIATENTIEESLHSHLLRSLCPVTGQPDSGSVLIQYRGSGFNRASLLRYIVSYREHRDFHEACVERIFMDIGNRCEPEQLTVYARYQRRGGIDINPYRSNTDQAPENLRLWRQ